MKTNIKSLLSLFCITTMLFGCEEKKDIVFESELPAFDLRENAILLEVIPPFGTSADDVIAVSGAFNGGVDSVVVTDVRWQLEKSSTADKWGIYLFPTDFQNGKTLADGFHFVSQKQGVERTFANTDVSHTLTVNVGSRTNIFVDRWAAYFNSNDDNDDKDKDVEIVHDGYVVYVLNETSWDVLSLYMWGDVNDLNGGWPGMLPTGVQTIDGVEFTYFDMGAANNNLAENLIFNNNGGGNQLSDYAFTIDHDIYLRITDSGVSEYVAGSEPEPEPETPIVEPETPSDEQTYNYTISVVDETGWSSTYLYMWGDVNDLTGSWPGMVATKIDDVYTVFEFSATKDGLVENLIFNNNDGSQLSDFAITLNRNYYLRITPDGVEEINAD